MSNDTIDRLNLDDSRVALQGYSPVSYVDDHVAEQGTPEHRVEHNGVVYYLTSVDQVAGSKPTRRGKSPRSVAGVPSA